MTNRTERKQKMAGKGEDILKKVNTYCEKVPILQKLATQLGVRPALIVMIAVGFLAPFLLFGI